MKADASFLEVRQYVLDNYSHFTWPQVKLENLCLQGGGGDESTIVKFTFTQDFVRHFFTPSSPLKGMLLWHSVGTGKTCSALSTATTTFENEGYTILWVTRSSLKNDIWKNMFDMVCHAGIQKKMKKGFKIPNDMPLRMRLLSKSWSIRPMSYKQFSNLVAKKNQYYSDLVIKNGAKDPLRKTLVIIDEAHKLYGGSDLAANEKPNMDMFHKALMDSYEISGDESVKLLLMTGTPITNDPMELIKMLNLIRVTNKQMPSTFETFSKVYLDESGTFTKKGKLKYLNDIAGNISYLNRERDARQFSQPIISNIYVPMSKSPGDKLPLGSKEDVQKNKLKANAIDEEIKGFKAKKQAETKRLRARCIDLKKEELINCKSDISAQLKDLNAKVDQDIKTKMQDKKQLMNDLKAMRSSLSKKAKQTDSQFFHLTSTCPLKQSKNKQEDPTHDNIHQEPEPEIKKPPKQQKKKWQKHSDTNVIIRPETTHNNDNTINNHTNTNTNNNHTNTNTNNNHTNTNTNNNHTNTNTNVKNLLLKDSNSNSKNEVFNSFLKR